MVVALVWFQAGCGALQSLSGRPRSQAAALAAADREFAEREERARLEAAIEGYQDLATAEPDDPDLQARLAQAWTALAYGHAEDPEQRRVYYETAREVSWRCLERVPSFSAAGAGRGGRIEPVVARRIPTSHTGCVLVLVESWSRLVAQEGTAAMALDLAPLRVLADRALEMTQDTVEHAHAEHLSGMVRALVPPAFEPPLEEAEQQMMAAIRAMPEALTPKADLAEYLYLQHRGCEAARPWLDEVLAGEAADSLEDRRARSRARRMAASCAADSEKAEENSDR